MWLVGCASAPPAPAAVQTAGAPAESAAVAAFRAYAATRLHVAPDSLVDNSAYTVGHHGRGAAKLAMMSPRGSSTIEIRGWTTADGTVITPSQNLGILFTEAGVWAASASGRGALAASLADDLVWAYGPGAEVESSSDGTRTPRLALDRDGAGTLVFYSRTATRSPDPEASTGGDGGGAGQYTFEDTVVLTADHKATLTRKRLDEPSSAR